MANTHKKIQTISVGSGGAASIEFTSIPATYTDLKILLSARGASGGAQDINIVINNNTSATYNNKQIQGDGSGISSSSGSGTGSTQISTATGSSNTASVFATSEIYIPNYLLATNKVWTCDSVTEQNGTTAYQTMRGGTFNNTAAITIIKLTCSGGNFAQYSTATLYGIKNS